MKKFETLREALSVFPRRMWDLLKGEYADVLRAKPYGFAYYKDISSDGGCDGVTMIGGDVREYDPDALKHHKDTVADLPETEPCGGPCGGTLTLQGHVTLETIMAGTREWEEDPEQARADFRAIGDAQRAMGDNPPMALLEGILGPRPVTAERKMLPAGIPDEDLDETNH